MQADRVAAICSCVARAILECSSYLSDIADGDHGAIRCFNRNAQHIPRVFNNARHFDRKTALTIVQAARRYEPVVPHDAVDNLIRGQLVGFQHCGIDDRFHQLFALAGHVCRQNTWLSLDGVAQIQRYVVEHPFRHISHQVDLQNREVRGGLLLDDGLFRIARKLNFGAVDRFASVQQRLV